MNDKTVGLLLRIFTLLYATMIFSQDVEWQQEREIVEQFLPQTITMNAVTIDSLLATPLTLNDCVAIALKNNISLEIDRMEYNRVYQAKRGTRQSFLPDLNISAERDFKTELDSIGNTADEVTADQADIALTERLPLGGAITFSHRLSRSTNLTSRLDDEPGRLWTISFTQPLLKGFGYSIAFSDVKLADLDFQIEQFQLQNAILTTIFEVKSSYFDVLRQKKLVSATEAALERDRKLRDISQAKVDAKLATRRDVLSAEIILQQDFANLVQAQSDYQNALDELKDVMGVAIDREITLAVTDLEFRPISIEESQWLDLALRNNYAIKVQEAVLRRSEFQTRLTGNSLLPDLSFEGSYSRLNDNDVSRDDRDRNLIGKLTLSYPLFNLAARADHQRTKIARKQIERTLENARRAVILDVRSVIRNLRNSEERVKILLKNIEAAQEKVEFATTMFNMGRASNLDITDAQEDLLSAEVELVQELADYYIEQARLEQILGGEPIIRN